MLLDARNLLCSLRMARTQYKEVVQIFDWALGCEYLVHKVMLRKKTGRQEETIIWLHHTVILLKPLTTILNP